MLLLERQKRSPFLPRESAYEVRSGDVFLGLRDANAMAILQLSSLVLHLFLYTRSSPSFATIGRLFD